MRLPQSGEIKPELGQQRIMRLDCDWSLWREWSGCGRIRTKRWNGNLTAQEFMPAIPL